MQTLETRGEHEGKSDVRDLIATIAQLRAQEAELMGFPTFAAFTAFTEAEQMAKTADAAKKLLIDLAPAALKKGGVALAEVPPRYRGPYFLHIWGNGYEAN